MNWVRFFEPSLVGKQSIGSAESWLLLWSVRLALSLATATLADEDSIESYLDQTYASRIDAVRVEPATIRIAGTLENDRDEFWVGGVAIEQPIDSLPAREECIQLRSASDGTFEVEVPRFVEHQGRKFDRITCRWRLVRSVGEAWKAASHAHYADDVACRSPNLLPARYRSKKGLGAWSWNRIPEAIEELDELGIGSITVNVVLNALASTTPQKGWSPFDWQGRTYYANEQALAHFDRTFVEAEKRGIAVLGILLVSNPATTKAPNAMLLGHPDCETTGHYAMPNVESSDGIAFYGAILHLMAERWSRDGSSHGRVHHWIMHNEVDAGSEWTNAGEKTAVEYMDLYVRSMRLAYLVLRQYDPHALPCISLTHHWAVPGNKRWYGSKRLLALLVRYGKIEGDFAWGLAFHPYPQSLFKPRTWEDDQATFDFATKKITPKNIEVLDAYMKQPSLLHRGHPRPVFLAENGFHSPNYSAKALEEQAAGMAFAWKKIRHLSSIVSWNYHNWIDNRQEGNLRIGLRKYPDDSDDPLGKKPIWHLYRDLDTDAEESACAPYLATVGVSSWESILHRQPIRTESGLNVRFIHSKLHELFNLSHAPQYREHHDRWLLRLRERTKSMPDPTFPQLLDREVEYVPVQYPM